MLCEAASVGIASSLLIAEGQRVWVRLGFSLVLAAIFDLFTFYVLRPV